jgi:hypothetical protein
MAIEQDSIGLASTWIETLIGYKRETRQSIRF